MTNEIKNTLKSYLSSGDFAEKSRNLETALNEILKEIEESNAKKERVIAEARLLDQITELVREYLLTYCEDVDEEKVNEYCTSKNIKSTLITTLDIGTKMDKIMNEFSKYFKSFEISLPPIDTIPPTTMDSFDPIVRFCSKLS